MEVLPLPVFKLKAGEGSVKSGLDFILAESGRVSDVVARLKAGEICRCNGVGEEDPV